jgi:hypothetical protein
MTVAPHPFALNGMVIDISVKILNPFVEAGPVSSVPDSDPFVT